MFTGLIEDVGRVRSFSGSLLMVGSGMAEKVSEGESISVDGSCLTVSGSVSSSDIRFHCSGETVARTIISGYVPGSRVNLERPLLPTDRMHGHMVTGHVDETASVLRVQRSGDGMTAWISYSSSSSRLLVPKGSVAVNGISLTIASLDSGRFSVAIIPETLSRTNAGEWRPGTRVNLEFDIIGKYVQKQMQTAASAAGLREYLERQ